MYQSRNAVTTTTRRAAPTVGAGATLTGPDLLTLAGCDRKIVRMIEFDRSALASLCREYGVRRLRVFGSVVRGEERADSDVDLIVELGRPTGFVELLRLERLLGEVFERPVDLVTEPYIRDSVVSSASVLLDAAA
jgi:predicted nucleotidyltransferase